MILLLTFSSNVLLSLHAELSGDINLFYSLLDPRCQEQVPPHRHSVRLKQVLPFCAPVVITLYFERRQGLYLVLRTLVRTLNFNLDLEIL